MFLKPKNGPAASGYSDIILMLLTFLFATVAAYVVAVTNPSSATAILGSLIAILAGLWGHGVGNSGVDQWKESNAELTTLCWLLFACCAVLLIAACMGFALLLHVNGWGYLLWGVALLISGYQAGALVMDADAIEMRLKRKQTN